MDSVADGAVGVAGGVGAPTQPPAVAGELFGDRLPLVLRYLQWLAEAGVERGLIGPWEADRLWQRHILNCAAIAPLIAPGSTVADIGSGAGLPGLVLALARPDLNVILIESMIRRTTFLDEVITDLGLRRVTVRRARAEDVRRGELEADVVTARALAPIDRLARWAAPLLAPSGVVLAIKGDTVAEEVTTGWPALTRAGFAEAVLFSVRHEVAAAGATPASPLVVVEEARWGGVRVETAVPEVAAGSAGSAHTLSTEPPVAEPPVGNQQVARGVALYRRPQQRFDEPTSRPNPGLG